MPTFIIVSRNTDPLGPNEIRAGETIQVSDGDVFIIDPSADRRTTFESADGNPTDFDIEFNQSNGNNFPVVVEQNLTPTVTVASNADLTNVDFDAELADAVNFVAGDNVTFGRLEGTATGPNNVTIGDGFTTNQNIRFGDGDNTVQFGDDANISDINTGDGADSISFGDRASVRDIETEDGNDDISFGDDATVGRIRTEDGDDTVTIGQNGQVDSVDGGRDNDTLNTQTPGLGEERFENSQVVCYAPDTMIETARGPCRVDQLRPADLVQTLDDGYCAVTWVRSDHRSLDGVSEDEHPILIAANALGEGLPAQDLIVSPQHRIFVGGHSQLEQYFPQEALVPAKALTALPGIRAMHGKRSMTWFHFALDRHHVIRANGLLSESLYLGRMVLNGLNPQDLARLETLYAPISPERHSLNGPAARPFISVKAAREALTGSQQNAARRATSAA